MAGQHEGAALVTPHRKTRAIVRMGGRVKAGGLFPAYFWSCAQKKLERPDWTMRLTGRPHFGQGSPSRP